MGTEVMIAGISLVGTIVGSLSGVRVSNKLRNYRIAQLEKKVEKHNNLCERMIVVEQSTKSAHHRIDDMEKEGA